MLWQVIERKYFILWRKSLESRVNSITRNMLLVIYKHVPWGQDLQKI